MAKAVVEWIVDGRPPEWSILSMTDIFEEEVLKNKDGAQFVFNPRKPPPILSPSMVQLNSVTYIGKWLEWVMKGKKKVKEPRFYSCKVLMVTGELTTISIINSNAISIKAHVSYNQICHVRTFSASNQEPYFFQEMGDYDLCYI